MQTKKKKRNHWEAKGKEAQRREEGGRVREGDDVGVWEQN